MKKRKAKPGAASGAMEVGDAKTKGRRRRRALAAVATVAAPEAVEDHEDEDEDDDEDEDEDEETETATQGKNAPASASRKAGDTDEIDMTFEFVDPSEDDFHSVKDLLKAGTWDFVDLNFSELADTLVEQGNIGTLVKSDADGDDATLCGLLTVLNLRQFEKMSWPGMVKQALLAKADKHAEGGAAEKLREIISNKGKHVGEVGLFISERFANLPLELVPSLHQALRDDIDWSCTTPECPEDERPFYRFTHFVGVVRCVATGAGAASGSKPAAKKRKRAALPVVPLPEYGGVAFPQAEHEVYMRKATLSFTFLVSKASDDRCGGKPSGQECRAVFVITRKAFEEVLTELQGTLRALK